MMTDMIMAMMMIVFISEMMMMMITMTSCMVQFCYF